MALALAALLLALTMAPSQAAAAGTASISGHVVDSAGVATAGVCVVADGGLGVDLGDAGGVQTDASGNYKLDGLPAGTYKVQFEDGCGTLLTQYYNGKATQSTADPVVLTSGQAKTGIDAKLAPSAKITGRVTDSAGAAVPGACVGASQTSGTQVYTRTDATGAYTLRGLPTGTYKVVFSEGCGTFDQYYDGKTGFDSADAVSVTVGQTRSGVNATLPVSGKITGHVADAAGGPISGVCVFAFTQGPSFGYAQAETDAGGNYTLRGLATGTYSVGFSDCKGRGYVTQYYDGKEDGSSATPVAVTLGQTRTGVDAKLVVGGKITGRVTDGAGAGAAGVCVYANASGGGQSASATTDATGAYTIIGLPAGSYKVQFAGCGRNYLSEFYNDKASATAADPVAVTLGGTTGGVDAKLATAGSITGHVTGSTTAGLAGMCVMASSSGTAYYGQSAVTDANGDYTIAGLSSGNYTVEFYDCGSGDYLTQFYSGQTDASSAAPVAVTAGQAKSGIDAKMVAGGKISGHVTDSANAAASGVCAFVYNADGSLARQSTATDATGAYSINGLRTGSYKVGFSSCGGNYAPEYYNDKQTFASADPVAVTAGQTTSSVDAKLATGGKISGRVTSASGAALAGVCARTVDGSGSARTDVNGNYTIAGLATGTYAVRFDDCGDGTYLSQYYNGATVQSSATSVSVTAGQTSTGIDARMVEGGRIAGHVTDSAGAGAVGVCVYAQPAAGGSPAVAVTDSTGSYTIRGLSTGSYKLQFTACGGNYASEYYNDKATFAAADPVAVTAAQTTSGVDAKLAPAGAISGRATDSAGAAVAGICVSAYPTVAGSPPSGSAYTDGSGNYTITGLAAGNYTVSFSDCSQRGYMTQYYNGKADAASATPVAVTAGATTPTIDAKLVLGGSIAGTVTDGSGAPASNACVSAQPAAGGSSTGISVTSFTGAYTLSGLAPGSYKVRFYSCSGTIGEYYAHKPDFASADTVVVTAGQTKPGVDGTVAAGATVAGHVTNSSGASLSGICVSAQTTGANAAYASTTTDGSGNYALRGLAAGTYKVTFSSCLSTSGNYVTQYYNAKADWSSADTLTLASTDYRTGVNAQLVPAASIAGHVTGPSGASVGNLCVSAAPALTSGPGASARTDSAGNYTLRGLAAGGYKVEFYSCDGSDYLTQWYAARADWSSADTITLAAAEARTGVNAQMQGGGGSIGGRVTSIVTSAGVASACVYAYTTDGPYAGIVASTQADGSGNYVLRGLRGGHYKVLFSDCSGSNYAAQYYSGATDWSSATVLTVTLGQPLTAINAVLRSSSDTTPPDTTIATKPGSPVNSGAADFSFSSSESGSTFECALDSGAFAPCTSPQHLLALADGQHTFAVRAIDAVKNVDPSPAAYTWTVDTKPPDTSITANPRAATNSTSADFSIASTETGSSFECKLDAGAWAACTSPVHYAGLAAGSHVFSTRATDAAKNVDASPATYTWSVDLTPPDTSLPSKPATLVSSAGAAFGLASTEAGSSFECKLDAGAWAACTSPKSLSGLADGQHTFSARATDPAGNVDQSPVAYTWTVDTIPPETSIGTKPAALLSSGAADFSFTANEAGASFECKLDAGDWAACTSPLHYAALGDGQHTFSVRALDAAKNADQSPASHTWTVDTTPPETSFGAKPPDATNLTTADFSLASSEVGSTFECKLDAGAWGACTTPQHLTALADGSHTFSARATDQAKNLDPTPASFTWKVDRTPPDSSIDSKPATITSATSADFGLAATEAGSTFECKLDAGAWGSCTTPGHYASLADGQHTFSLRATDPAGNLDPSPATYSWTVDTQPPDTSITAKPAALVATGTASFSFSSTEAGGSFECKTDAGNWGACSSPAQLTGLADGQHTFSVRAIDAAKNADPSPASYGWTVDQAPPDTSIATKPAATVSSTAADLSFTSTEAGSTFECKLDAAAYAACTTPVHLTGLAQGQHTFSVRAIDPLKNVDATPASYSWTVDTAAPDTSISSHPPALTGSSWADFSFASTEPLAATFECRLDAGAWGACTSPRHLSGLADGAHTFSMRAIDAASNVDATPAAFTWTIDPKADHPPAATLGLSPDQGTAPLDTAAQLGGSDPDGDPLTFRLTYDDGKETTGSLPHPDVPHKFSAAGDHLVRLEVSDGRLKTVATARVSVAAPEPLAAHAGDDRVVTAGSAVHLDGGGSRPAAGIASYHWAFGDGQSGDGAALDHVYADPGSYSATLTVTRDGETSSDDVAVKVEPPAPSGLAVSIATSGGAPIPGAQALVITSDGTHHSATVDGNGTAHLIGLADGSYTVYGWAKGYLPGTAAVTVSHGEGSTAIALDPGEPASAKIDSRRLTLDEVKAAGIDPNDPANQNVFHFDVALALTPEAPPVTFSGYGGSGGFLGGSGGSVGFGGAGGGAGSCTAESCTTRVGDDAVTVHIDWVDDQPMLTWMVIPFKGRMLKEFFDVSMVVQNLAGPQFTLTHGSANLELPDGLSLAPTARPQTAAAAMPDITGGGSATQTWVVRGDAPGSYAPTADYSASLDPIGMPISIHAAIENPMKVWGTSALHLVVDTDSDAYETYPYHLRVGVTNVADVPVYNVGLEALEGGRVNFIYQPRQQREQETDEVKPGETFWTGDYVLVPKVSGKVDLSHSFVRKVSGDSGYSAEITVHPPAHTPATAPAISATALDHGVGLHWDPVPGATSYEIYRTPDQDTPFPDEPIARTQNTSATIFGLENGAPGQWYAVSAVVNGRNEMDHHMVQQAAAAPVSSGEGEGGSGGGASNAKCDRAGITVGVVAVCADSVATDGTSASGHVVLDGGVDVGGPLRIDPQAKTIDAPAGTSLSVQGPGRRFDLGSTGFELDGTGTTDAVSGRSGVAALNMRSPIPGLDFKVAGLSIAGENPLKLFLDSDEGGGVLVAVQLGLDFFEKQTSKNFVGVGLYHGAGLKAMGGKVSFPSFHVKSWGFDGLSLELNRGSNTWTATGGLKIPKLVDLKADGSVVDGGIDSFHLTVGGENVPLGDSGFFFDTFGGGFEGLVGALTGKGSLKISATTGGFWGVPKAPVEPLYLKDVTFKIDLAGKASFDGSVAFALRDHSPVTGNMHLGLDFSSGGFRADGGIGVTGDLPGVKFNASEKAAFTSRHFTASGDGDLDLRAGFKGHGSVVVSDAGAGGSGQLCWHNVCEGMSFALRWDDLKKLGGFHLPSFDWIGADPSSVITLRRPAAGRAKAGAGAGGFDVPKGRKLLFFDSAAETGAPSFSVVAPDGTVYDTTKQRPDALVGTDEEHHLTMLTVVAPDPGRWQVRDLPAGAEARAQTIRRIRPVRARKLRVRTSKRRRLPRRTRYVPISWSSSGLPAGTRVSVYASRQAGKVGTLLRGGLRPSGHFRVPVKRLAKGQNHLHLVVSNGGIPFQDAPVPGVLWR